MSWYVGKLATGTRVPFAHNRAPTEKSHGRVYKIVEGPFKTREGAYYFAVIWNRGGQITQDMAERHVARKNGTPTARSERYGDVRGVTPKRPYSTADGRTFESLEKAIGHVGKSRSTRTTAYIFRRNGRGTSEPYYVLEPDGSQRYVVT
jgi:hypothetical protein